MFLIYYIQITLIRIVFNYLVLFIYIMDISIDTCNNMNIDTIKLHKMGFLYNALENGWMVKKKKIYIFLQKIMKVRKKFY